MYVAIRLYDGVKNADEAIAKAQHDFLPLISKISGFQEYYAVKSGPDSLVTFSIFKDKPGADESVKAASRWVQTTIPRLMPNPPKVHGGEVAIHKAVPSKKAAA